MDAIARVRAALADCTYLEGIWVTCVHDTNFITVLRRQNM